MAGQADGSVVVDTVLDTGGFEKDSQKLNSAIKSLGYKLKSIGEAMEKAANGSVAAIAAVGGKIIDTRAQVDSLERELDELGRSKIKTDEYMVIEKQIAAANKELQRHLETQGKMHRQGVSRESSRWKNEQIEIEYTRKAIQKLEDEKAAMEQNGTAYISGTDTEEYRQLAGRLAIAVEMLREFEAQADDLEQSLEPVPNEVRKITEESQRIPLSQRLQEAASSAGALASRLMGGRNVTSVLKGIATGARNAASALLHLGNSSKKTSKSMGMNLKTILRYGFGIRSVFVLLNKIRSAIKEGFGNLAKESPAFNRAVSQMMTALAQFKNSVSAAFAPLVEVAAPALTRLINLLSAATTQLGMFIAALTGKSSFMKATTVAQDYAASLDKSSQSASKTADAMGDVAKETRQLASFDDLNVLSDNSKSKGGSDDAGAGAAAMFEEVPVEIPAWMDAFKGAFTNVLDVIKSAWETAGADVVAAWEKAKGAIIGLLWDVATTFYKVFTDGYGYAWLVSLFELLASVLNIIGAIGNAFRTAWNDDNRGYNYVAALFLAYTSINNLLAAIGRTFAEAWESGIGVEIASNLLEIFTNINLAIAWFAEKIRSAWEDTGLGVSIWTTILTIVNDVLAAANRMSEATVNWAKDLDFEPALAAVDRLLKAIEPLVDIISNALAWAYENVLLPIGKWTIEDAVPAVIDAVSAALELLHTIAEKLQPVATWLWENFLQPLGEWAGDVFIGAINTITDVLEKLNDLLSGNTTFSEFIDSLSPAEAILLGVGTALGVVAAVMGTVAVVSGVLSAALGILGGVIAFLTSPIGLVIAAVAAIVAGFVLLYQHSETFRNFIDGVVEKAKNLLPGVIQGIESGWNTLTTKLSEIWNSIVTGFKEFFGIASPSTVFAELGDFLIGGLLQGISNAWQTITEFFGNVLGPLKDQLSETWENIKSAASEKWESIKQSVSEKWEGIKSATQSVTEAIREKASDSWDNVKTSVTDSLAKAKSGAQSAWDSIKSTASKTGSNIASGVSSAFTNVKKHVTDNLTTAKTNASTLFSNIKQTVSTAGDNIKNTVSTDFTAVKTHITNNLNNAQSTASSVLGTIKSTVSSATSDMRNTVSANFESIQSTISGKISSVKSVISSGFEEARRSITDKMQNAMDIVNNQGWYNVGSNICSGIANGIYAGWQWLMDTVCNVASSLLDGAKTVLGIASPSRAFRDQVGKMIPAGVAEGVDEGSDEVEKSAEQMADKALTAASGLADAISEEVQGGTYAIGKIGGADALGASLDSFADRVANSFAALSDRLQSIVDGMTFNYPVMATVGAVPYGVSNKPSSGGSPDDYEDLISVIIQSFNQQTRAIVAALSALEGSGATGITTQQVIDDINSTTRRNGKSPILGVG